MTNLVSVTSAICQWNPRQNSSSHFEDYSEQTDYKMLKLYFGISRYLLDIVAFSIKPFILHTNGRFSLFVYDIMWNAKVDIEWNVLNMSTLYIFYCYLVKVEY